MSQRPFYRLSGQIKNYPWGSTTALAKLQKRQPSGVPEAEIWWGTHPGGMAMIQADYQRPLSDLVQLPYLVKLLAATKPLSLQAHPTMPQAEAGYHDENKAGLPLDDPRRNFKDTNHKPEMLVALTDFTALHGFRQPAHAAETFSHLTQLMSEYSDNTELQADMEIITQQLVAGQFRDAFLRLVDRSSPWAQWCQEVMSAIAHATTLRSQDHHVDRAHRLAADYPGDQGVLATVMLNEVKLAPGQALFVPDGTIHAYQHGLGLEVMAASDNVLRGGMTKKNVDVAELANVVRFESGPEPALEPVSSVDGVTEFRPPINDFRLTRWDIPEGETQTFSAEHPMIIVATAGTLKFRGQGCRLQIRAGFGAFVLPGHKIKVTAKTDATFFGTQSAI